MLTHEQIKELAALASALQKITDREDKAAFNLRQRYAIERGELKATASAEVRSLHRIDLEADYDVAAWRQFIEEQASESPAAAPGNTEGPAPRGRPRT